MPYRPQRACAWPGCYRYASRGNYCPKHQYQHEADYFPSLKGPLSIECILVCGAPASGKSTFVEARKSPHDIVIDLDVIKAEINGKPLHSQHDASTLTRAIRKRNLILEGLQQQTASDGRRLWFVVGAPTPTERGRWTEILTPSTVYMMMCPKPILFERIEARKSDSEHDQKQAVIKWFDKYEPMSNDTRIDTA